MSLSNERRAAHARTTFRGAFARLEALLLVVLLCSVGTGCRTAVAKTPVPPARAASASVAKAEASPTERVMQALATMPCGQFTSAVNTGAPPIREAIGVARFSTLSGSPIPSEGVADQIRQWIDRQMGQRAHLSAKPTELVQVDVSSEADAVSIAQKQGLRAVVWGTLEHCEAGRNAPVNVIVNGNVRVEGNIKADHSKLEFNKVEVQTSNGQYLVDMNLTILGAGSSSQSHSLASNSSLIVSITAHRAWTELALILDSLAITTLVSEGRTEEARTLADKLLTQRKRPDLPSFMHAILAELCSLRTDSACALEETELVLASPDTSPELVRFAHLLRSYAYFFQRNPQAGVAEQEQMLAAMNGEPLVARLEQRADIAFSRFANDLDRWDAYQVALGKIADDARETPHAAHMAMKMFLGLLDARMLDATAAERWHFPGADRATPVERAELIARLNGEALQYLDAAMAIADHCTSVSNDMAQFIHYTRGSLFHSMGQCSKAVPLLQGYIDYLGDVKNLTALDSAIQAYGELGYCICVQSDGPMSGPASIPRWPEFVSMESLRRSIKLHLEELRLRKRLPSTYVAFQQEPEILNDLLMLSLEYSRQNGYPPKRGVLVVGESKEGGPLQAGDLLMSYDGQPVNDLGQLEQVMKKARNKRVPLEVLRGTETLHTSLASGALGVFVLLQRGNPAEIHEQSVDCTSGSVYTF